MQNPRSYGFWKVKPSVQKGFTLIELAIAFVILGLLAGGILVSQDLIKAAEIRAFAGQKGKYDLAVNSFRTKFNDLPGDTRNAARFGFLSLEQGNVRGRGDGNGLIQTSYVGAPDPIRYGYVGEPSVLFAHLIQANMITDSIAISGSATPDAIYTYSPDVHIRISNSTMPSTRIGRSRIYVNSHGGYNVYVVAGFTGIANRPGNFSTNPLDILLPSEAYQIDLKLDDGIPNTGIVRPFTMASDALSLEAAGETGASDAGAAAPAAGDCWSTANNSYATTLTALGCQLRIRASF